MVVVHVYLKYLQAFLMLFWKKWSSSKGELENILEKGTHDIDRKCEFQWQETISYKLYFHHCQCHSWAERRRHRWLRGKVCRRLNSLPMRDWITDVTSYMYCLEGLSCNLLLGAGLLSIPDQVGCALLSWTLKPSEDGGHLSSDLLQGCTTLCRRNFSLCPT